MWIANSGQRSFMESKASFLLSKLKEWEKHGKDALVGFIFDDFCEMVRMGYSIAQDEVCATPWEYLSQPISVDAARNDAEMNTMAAEGWDLHMASSGWLFWRRRKAVREIEEAKLEEQRT